MSLLHTALWLALCINLAAWAGVYKLNVDNTLDNVDECFAMSAANVAISTSAGDDILATLIGGSGDPNNPLADYMTGVERSTVRPSQQRLVSEHLNGGISLRKLDASDGSDSCSRILCIATLALFARALQRHKRFGAPFTTGAPRRAAPENAYGVAGNGSGMHAELLPMQTKPEGTV